MACHSQVVRPSAFLHMNSVSVAHSVPEFCSWGSVAHRPQYTTPPVFYSTPLSPLFDVIQGLCTFPNTYLSHVIRRPELSLYRFGIIQYYKLKVFHLSFFLPYKLASHISPWLFVFSFKTASYLLVHLLSLYQGPWFSLVWAVFHCFLQSRICSITYKQIFFLFCLLKLEDDQRRYIIWYSLHLNLFAPDLAALVNIS